jgi:hypothetical protein
MARAHGVHHAMSRPGAEEDSRTIVPFCQFMADGIVTIRFSFPRAGRLKRRSLIHHGRCCPLGSTGLGVGYAHAARYSARCLARQWLRVALICANGRRLLPREGYMAAKLECKIEVDVSGAAMSLVNAAGRLVFAEFGAVP